MLYRCVTTTAVGKESAKNTRVNGSNLLLLQPDEPGSGDGEPQQESDQYNDEYQNYDEEEGGDKNKGSGEQVPNNSSNRTLIEECATTGKLEIV